MHTYCNPLNIPYQYQHYGKTAHREAADPTLVLFKGKYYMFVSMCGGFFWSDNMLDWNYHQNKNLDIYRYAPDVREINGKLVFCASNRDVPSTFWQTDDPLSDNWEKISEPFDFWDPNTFQDDDGRVYLYWGCAADHPIYGQELDPETLMPIGDRCELIFDNHDKHGWERIQPDGKDAPYIEGAFMNKFGGKYYLQYAAPGTEFATYGDGVYVGESPLGPFTYQAHNPVSFKSGGFITGAGHGSTIEDKHGNLWHASTMRISVNAPFERRVGLFPAGVDKDGVLFCNQNFADYPLNIPNGKFDPLDITPKWMLLSYNKPTTASSCADGHPAALAVNEDVCTCWCANGSEGEWLKVDLGDVYEVGAVQINLADVDVPINKRMYDASVFDRWIDLDNDRYTRWFLESSVDGENWDMLVDKREAKTDLSNDYIELESACEIRYLRLTAAELPYGEKFAVSGLRVFGKGNGTAPDTVSDVEVTLVDSMTAKVCWNAANGAQGYNVLYGIAPDKLYLSHLIYGEEQVLLTALNKEQSYFVRVDSFSEDGITTGEVIKLR